MATSVLEMSWPTYDGSAIGYYLFRKKWWGFYETHAKNMTLDQAAQVIVRKCFPPGDQVLEKLELFAAHLEDIDTVWEFLDGRYGHLVEILTFANDGIWMLPEATEEVASILHLYREAGSIDCAMLASPWNYMWRDKAVGAMIYEKLPDSEKIQLGLRGLESSSEIPGQFIFEFMNRRIKEIEHQHCGNTSVQVGAAFLSSTQLSSFPVVEHVLPKADGRPLCTAMHWAEAEEWDEYDKTGVWGPKCCTPEQPHKASECIPQKLKPGQEPPPWDHEWAPPWLRFCCPAECQRNVAHRLQDCPAFIEMSVRQRWRVAKKDRRCYRCLSAGHPMDECDDFTELCKESDPICNYHHELLHVTKDHEVEDDRVVVSAGVASGQQVKDCPSLLPAQKVDIKGGSTATVMYDSGSQVTLVDNKFAKKSNLKVVEKSNIIVNGMAGGNFAPENVYEVSLKKFDGGTELVKAHGVARIMSDLPEQNLEQAQHVFSVTEKLTTPAGKIDLLMGVDYLYLHPLEVRREGKLTLYVSMFGHETKWVVAGVLGQTEKGHVISMAARVSHFVPVDFLSAEALGTDLPRFCRACKKCEECQFRTNVLSFIENEEYCVILNNLSYDVEAKKWTTKYPFVENPGVLQDNYGQAMACMKSLEKKLIKKKEIEEFNEVFMESVERGVFRKLSETEIEEWSGPVNYITTVVAYKEGPHSTTPLRICMNSSMRQPSPVGKSLNDILMKGPSALADLFAVTLGFREYRYALTKDLSKFYNCVLADEEAQHTRRVMWRFGDENAKPSTYVTTTVNFGDKPAGCIAIAAARETAEMFGRGKEEAAWFLKNRTYVDDCTAGSNSLTGLKKISKDLEDIVALGGFKFKETLMSGDEVKEDVPPKILGLMWDTRADTLAVDVKINFAGKSRGAKLAPDVDLEEEVIDEVMPEVITKRIVWRVAQGQYDPVGLLAPYLVQFKIVMRDLCAEDGKVKGWDEPVSDNIREAFLRVLEGLKELRLISFPRSIYPATDPIGPPTLMVFGDGSREAYCALAYVRWELRDGTVKCQLITGKSRVSPKQKISIPRIELLGSLLAVRLAKRIKDAYRFKFGKVRFFTDSSAVLGMLQCNSLSFLEFVGTRVSEIKSKSCPEKEWFWVPTDCNPADLGTRENAAPADLREGTWYQNGMKWMYEPEERWPAKKKFSEPPEEERNKKQKSVGAVFRGQSNLWSRFSSLTKLIRTVATVLYAVKRWKSWKRSAQLKVPVRKHCPLTLGYLESAKHILIEGAQEELKERNVASLLPEKVPYVDVLGIKRVVIIVGARLKDHYRIGYDQKGLPILPAKHPLSYLYLREAHEVNHGGINSTVMRSRCKVWIQQAARLAQKIKDKCHMCALLWKKTGEQKMAPLPHTRIGPAPIFDSVQIDLFGPLEYTDMVKKRTTGKGWGVMFVCTASSAIHLELTESYSTDSFLQALRRFMCLHGTPSRIQSDHGEQLVAASKQVKDWDFEHIQEWCLRDKKIEWHIVPTGGQHMNGQAERLIGEVKKILNQMLLSKKYSFNELATILYESAVVVNSRPIGIKGRSNDLEAGSPITPLHLMLGRATIEAPRVVVEKVSNLNRRLEFVESVKNEFWNKWRAVVFQGLDRSYKWRKEFRNMRVGDVVLLKNETAASAQYKIARISEILPDKKDELIRKVVVAYKNPGENVFRYSERPINKLSLVVPVEEVEAEEIAAAKAVRSAAPPNSKETPGKPFLEKPGAQSSNQDKAVPAPQPAPRPAPQPAYQPAPQPAPQPAYQPATQPAYQPAPQPAYQPAVQPAYLPAPQPAYQPALRPAYQPAYQPTEPHSTTVAAPHVPMPGPLQTPWRVPPSAPDPAHRLMPRQVHFPDVLPTPPPRQNVSRPAHDEYQLRRARSAHDTYRLRKTQRWSEQSKNRGFEDTPTPQPPSTPVWGGGRLRPRDNRRVWTRNEV